MMSNGIEKSDFGNADVTAEMQMVPNPRKIAGPTGRATIEDRATSVSLNERIASL